MVGTATYTPEEIKYVLNCVLDNKRHESITRGFQSKYGRPLSTNQVRYLKNKYGTSPQFNCPLVNSAKARANNPKRRRRRARADTEARNEDQQLSDAQIAVVEAHGNSLPFSELNSSHVMNSSSASASDGTLSLQTNNTVAGLGIKRVVPIRRQTARRAPAASEPPVYMPRTDTDWPRAAVPEQEFLPELDFNSDLTSVQQSNIYDSLLNNTASTYQPHLDFNFNSLFTPDLPTHCMPLAQWSDPYSSLPSSLPVPDLNANVGQPYWMPHLPNDAPAPMLSQPDFFEEQDTWTLTQQTQSWDTDPTLPLQFDSDPFTGTMPQQILFNTENVALDDFVNPNLFIEPMAALDPYNGWAESRQAENGI